MSTSANQLLIALDIDGTLLLEDGTFAPDVIDVVREAALSELVTLATGRSWEATSPILDELGLRPEYVICANGASILSRSDDGYDRHTIETFDPSEVLTFLVEHLPEASYLVELPDGARLYSRFVETWDLERHGSRLTTVDEMHGLQVTRVVVVSADHSEPEFNALVARLGLSQVTYSVGWSAWLDIAPLGVNKATALEKVSGWLGHDTAATVAIGDGRNDIEMLSWVRDAGGRSFAMGQAPADVQAAASDVTLPVTDGGVAAALAELGVAGVHR